MKIVNLLFLCIFFSSNVFSENFITSTIEDRKHICAIHKLDYTQYSAIFPLEKFKKKDRFHLITLPKSGTNLIMKALCLITGNSAVGELGEYQFYGKAPKGLDLNTLSNHYFSVQHFYYPEILNYFIESNSKVIVLIRDPRDILLSQSYAFKNLFKDESWDNASIEQNIKMLLDNPLYFGLLSNIEYQLNLLKQLIQEKEEVYLVRFENLIGSKGNGNDILQKKELSNLAEFLGIPLNEQQINFISANLFGGTPTFRQGLIGNWVSYFDEDSKNAFKEKYNSYLIEFGYEKNDQW